MKRYIDADKMVENTETMRSVADAIAIDGIIKYVEDNIVTDVAEVKPRGNKRVCREIKREVWDS